MSRDTFKRPRRAKGFSGAERDGIIADLKRIMTTWNIGPTTLGRMAEIASREMVR